jgi:hypothetical protein
MNFQKIYGDSPYEMDCSFFTQIINHNPEEDNLLLTIGKDSFHFHTLCEKLPSNVYYMTPKDTCVTKHLMEMPVDSKGMYLTKLADGSYLGLSGDGPKVISGVEWAKRCLEGLVDFANDRDCDIILRSQKGLLNCYWKLGKLDDWVITNLKDSRKVFTVSTVCDDIPPLVDDVPSLICGTYQDSQNSMPPLSLTRRLAISFDGWSRGTPRLCFVEKFTGLSLIEKSDKSNILSDNLDEKAITNYYKITLINSRSFKRFGNKQNRRKMRNPKRLAIMNSGR